MDWRSAMKPDSCRTDGLVLQDLGDLALPEARFQWPAKRRELLNWFRTNAPSLAEAYEGGVLMLMDERFPGRVHFIAHAIRDISDRLIDVLDPQKPASHVQYAQHLNEIEPLWRKPPQLIVNEQNETPASEFTSIDSRVASLIDNLVQAHRMRGERVSNYERLFRYLLRKNEPSGFYVIKRLAQDFREVRQWFMDRTHLRAGAPPCVAESELQSKFGAFEGMLHSFVGDFFTGTRDLDEILRQANA
jgi:hypothetical protein